MYQRLAGDAIQHIITLDTVGKPSFSPPLGDSFGHFVRISKRKEVLRSFGQPEEEVAHIADEFYAVHESR